MGSPISVTMANLVMEYVEETVLERYAHPIGFYKRYVDDTFVILNKNHVADFHLTLNSVESSIQFTHEVEQNCALPFLDVNVFRNSTGRLDTTVYRKACDTGNLLSFNSHHPVEHKRAVVKTLLHRSERISSNPQLRASEDAVIVDLLMKRNYPKRFIDNTRKQMGQRRSQDNERHRTGQVTIPYLKGVSESIRRALAPLNIRTAFKPHRKLRDLISKPKDYTPPESQCGVVYKLNCLDCDASYIGETGRRRCTRLNEHKRDVAKATHATRAKTELVDHCWNTGHSFDFENASTLAREQRWGPRRFVESWFIRSDSSACNSNRGPLPEVYADLLK